MGLERMGLALNNLALHLTRSRIKNNLLDNTRLMCLQCLRNMPNGQNHKTLNHHHLYLMSGKQRCSNHSYTYHKSLGKRI